MLAQKGVEYILTALQAPRIEIHNERQQNHVENLKDAARSVRTRIRREKQQKRLKKQLPTVSFFDPSHFSEYWKAGHKSEYEVFCATLDWIDAALERPVSHDRWGQLLFTLEQLPLLSVANADVRHGAW